MPKLAFLADNWTWLVGALLAALFTYWWWDERNEHEHQSPGETVDRVTSRAESATGGALSGFRALLVGLASIGMTIAVEFLQLAGDLNELLGGVPFIVGYLIYGGLSFVGIEWDISPQVLGFAFILILLVAAMAKFGQPGGDRA
ncbi:hypothetical protein [Halorussus sp. MSC15.2]|uniref:hypothetical protein n=1 Tax=Halorussus sp. MSC15.2 TaxID=2283638 RepID=UPI0013D8D4C8|nr:hypothetical protein [Halorussus sp. MSC15.2]NEU56752.1 hypothetical protein [Halorussus sp. MSC15.2]